MRIRATLLFAAIGILFLPFLVSRSQDNKLRSSAPSSLIAFAGHVQTNGHSGEGEGEECHPCGIGDCVCDPGESVSQPDQGKPGEPPPPDQGDPNLGPLALLAALALLVWRLGR